MNSCAPSRQTWILAVALSLAAHLPAHAEKHPAELKGLRSTHGDVPTQIKIVNNSGKPIKIFWIDYDGNRKEYGVFGDGEAFDQETFISHPWVVTDEADKPLGLYLPDAQKRIISIVPAGEEPLAEASSPAASTPELAVLAPFARRFDSTSEVKSRDLPQPLKMKGVSEGAWIHDGQFLRQTWSVERGDGVPAMNGSAIMTFDPREKAYRRWSFISTGPVEESRGEWDAATHTMTWTADGNELGGKTVTTSTFDDANRETWSIHFKDDKGEDATEVIGVSTPRGK